MTDSLAPNKSPISWPTVLFIAGTTLAAAAAPFYAYFVGFSLWQVVLAGVYYVLCGMAITVGYHRLIAHRTFKCRGWAKAVLLVVGSASWQGSALEWASDHVRHHAYIDTDRDPYNIKRGFWYAHIGWLLREGQVGASPVPVFLQEDGWVRWQHRHYYALAITMSYLVPFLVGGFGGMLLVGGARVVAQHHTTWLINSWAHVGSNRPYSAEVSAVDNWFLAFFTFGEGFHNYHHAFPGDYRNGVRKLAWDPSKWTIWLASKLRIAWDLKRISPQIRWNRRLETLFSLDASLLKTRRSITMTRSILEAHMQKTQARIAALSDRLGELRIPRAAQFREMIPSSADLAELRRRVRHATAEWKANHDARRLARAHRIEQLLERLITYKALLERLAAYQSRLEAVPA